MKSYINITGRILFRLTVFVMLTVVTQVGGVVYLIHLISMQMLKVRRWWKRWPAFIALYFVFTFLIIPPMAKLNNRVPLPFFGSENVNVRPHSLFFSLTNRHYVRPELREMLYEIAEEMDEKYPGIQIEYLDANFPLLKKFRMYPHIRHDDGRKLDIAYIRKKPTEEYVYRYFSLFGYGYCVKPLPGETDRPAECSSKGYWQYNIIEKYVPDQDRKQHTFPVEENTELMQSIASHPDVRYVITEPHLQERMGLSGIDNIGNLGCWAIRHDDHMHVVGHK